MARGRLPSRQQWGAWLLALAALGIANFRSADGEDPPPASDESLDKEAALKLARDLEGQAAKLQGEGRYADALAVARRFLVLEERVFGREDPEVAGCLSSIATLLQLQGSYTEARPLFDRALAILRSAFGEDHPQVASMLNNLAALLTVMGAHAEARPMYERALAIFEKALGKDHPQVAVSLSNLATLLKNQGAYTEARPFCERALAIFERTLGKEHPSVAASLSDLATLLQLQGSLAEAKPLFERALAIREKALGKDHPDFASSLNNLAALLTVMGAYAEARPLYERALAISEKALGKDHPEVATILSNLARVLTAQGAYAEASQLYARALASKESAFGKDHADVAVCLNNFATLLEIQGAYGDAKPVYRRALDIHEARARNQFAALAEGERRDLLRSTRLQLENWLRFSPRVGGSGHTEVLRFKGLVMRAAFAERTLMRAANAAALKSVVALRAAERGLARLANAMPPEREPEKLAEWRKNYAEAAAERERLSLALSRDVAPFRQALERMDIGLKDVQAQLHGGEALVDVLQSGSGYLAWVVGREGEPQRIDLGKVEDIEAAAEALTEATRHAESLADAAWIEAGRRFRTLVWDPVAAKLPKGVTTVYVSPDAALAAVPLAALPGKDPGKFLIDEVGIVLLSMAQDLVPWPARGAAGGGALVVGGVDFGAAATSKDLDADPSVPALARSTDRAPRGSEFVPLPATAAEAAAIKARLGEGALALLGSDATEARLRREAKGRRILHLATHGFVRDDLMRGLGRRKDDKLALLDADLERHLAAGHDPMLLAGLAMAGANPREGGYGDDGILTALEASMLDLDSCDLVVLSACETAKGTAESGEGVLGLVSGFQIAGAKRVIGSLWKVDDEATRLLMARLYDGILRKESPLPPAAALREASLWLRSQKGGDGRSFEAPSYWAAFVCYGR